jgi:hypothetical protein
VELYLHSTYALIAWHILLRSEADPVRRVSKHVEQARVLKAARSSGGRD